MGSVTVCGSVDSPHNVFVLFERPPRTYVFLGLGKTACKSYCSDVERRQPRRIKEQRGFSGCPVTDEDDENSVTLCVDRSNIAVTWAYQATSAPQPPLPWDLHAKTFVLSKGLSLQRFDRCCITRACCSPQNGEKGDDVCPFHWHAYHSLPPPGSIRAQPQQCWKLHVQASQSQKRRAEPSFHCLLLSRTVVLLFLSNKVKGELKRPHNNIKFHPKDLPKCNREKSSTVPRSHLLPRQYAGPALIVCLQQADHTVTYRRHHLAALRGKGGGERGHATGIQSTQLWPRLFVRGLPVAFPCDCHLAPPLSGKGRRGAQAGRCVFEDF